MCRKRRSKLVDLLQKSEDQMVSEGSAPKTRGRIYHQVQKFFRVDKVKIEAKSVNCLVPE